MDILTPPNIMFVVGLGGALFGIFNYFKNPQEDLEKKQLIAGKDLDTKATILAQKEAEGKAGILAQQVEWEKNANEKKFAEFGLRLDSALSMAQNHIHTVDTKVDGLLAMVNTMGNELTKLSTIIDERIPKIK